MTEPEKRKRQSPIWIRSPSLSRDRAAQGPAVDLGAAGAAEVLEEIAVAAADDPGVPRRHALATQDDVAVRVPAQDRGAPGRARTSGRGVSPLSICNRGGVVFFVVMTMWPSRWVPHLCGGRNPLVSTPSPDPFHRKRDPFRHAQTAVQINDTTQATIVAGEDRSPWPDRRRHSSRIAGGAGAGAASPSVLLSAPAAEEEAEEDLAIDLRQRWGSAEGGPSLRGGDRTSARLVEGVGGAPGIPRSATAISMWPITYC